MSTSFHLFFRAWLHLRKRTLALVLQSQVLHWLWIEICDAQEEDDLCADRLKDTVMTMIMLPLQSGFQFSGHWWTEGGRCNRSQTHKRDVSGGPGRRRSLP